jgi:hypothetical protein
MHGYHEIVVLIDANARRRLLQAGKAFQWQRWRAIYCTSCCGTTSSMRS